MKIVYVTANLPHGSDEAFLIPEIASLRELGHEVLIVPRSPVGKIIHGAALVSLSYLEPLLSWKIARTGAASVLRHARRFAVEAGRLRRSRSMEIAVKNLAVLPKAAWLAGLATRWGAEHIHCHWAGTTATMAMVASKLSGIPWSLTLHRWDIVEDNLLRAKAHSATLVRFISEDGRRMGVERGVPDADHVRVVHMGVDLPQAPSQRANGRIVICPARLVEVKGHRYLLEAWKELQEAGCDAELWLAGDGPLRNAIEAQIHALSLEDSVCVLGTVPHDKLLGMYERDGIAAVVVPSIDMGAGCHEGIPVALIEAMSYGIPVVATPTGGTAELIRPGTGVLVPPANPAALATAIASLLSNPPRARHLGQSGRNHVSREFDARRIAAELARAFEQSRAHSGHVNALWATS